MKKIHTYWMLLLTSTLAACSLDKVLEPSDEVKIAVMETVDTVRTVPGDTVSFKFIASTNVGGLQRIEVTKQEGNFTPLPDSVKFALVDETLGLTIDSEGYLSRPVSTVMMIYPVAMANNTDMIGKMVGVTFRVSSDAGKSAEMPIRFKVVNHRTYDTELSFFKMYGQRNGNCFYNPYKHVAHSANTFEQNKAQVELVAYADEQGTNWCMDPAAPETETLMTADGYTYKAAEMRKTLVYKLENVDFDTFGDNDFAQLDFSQATHKVSMLQDDVIAFKTSNGRKGILHVTFSGTYPSVTLKYQAIAQ